MFIDLQIRSSDMKVYRPLAQYNAHPNITGNFLRVGLPNRTQCSSFYLEAMPQDEAATRLAVRTDYTILNEKRAQKIHTFLS